MANPFSIIDADAHVIETEHTWDYLDACDRKYRPKLYSTPEDTTRQYWVIDVVKRHEAESGYEPHPIGMTMQFPVRDQTRVNEPLLRSRAEWSSRSLPVTCLRSSACRRRFSAGRWAPQRVSHSASTASSHAMNVAPASPRRA
jgi:hypothetical protein